MTRRSKPGPKPRAEAERFWEKVRRGPGCWLWDAGRNADGYGTFMLRSQRHILAHRMAWRLTRGPIPRGKRVLHECDNPPCVRPAHLKLGTMKDNTADMMARGRRASTAGTRNGRAKLTRAKIRRMRVLRGRGASYDLLGRRFGVSNVAARKAVLGINYTEFKKD